ncbi:DUF1838 family protein [Blastomonas sp. UPD001]|uniref:DUF1838 family protein n=1 Tax=Blastomonas sp. UPD001 TaxID=2217673 RepID=UPI000E3427C2|nr:DUF1838 family protein [Blastomonas sp. UPD001]MBL0965574.1 DUF1838 family protein [Blastomonas sp.]
MRIGTLTLAALLAATTLAGPALARPLDPAKPEDALEIMKRTQCGVKDNVPAVYRWQGRIYSRRQGEPDKHLFNMEGMNIRQCVTVTDPQRGTGYRMVSREITLYLDPKTNEVLRTWQNPYTGKTVEVMHIANDPVNSRPSFPISADGKPYSITLTRMGDTMLMPVEAPLYYVNPLAGDYQDYVGNKYHAMEIFDFSMPVKALDTATPSVNPTVAWVRISDWMPWMMMEGRDGQMVFNAMGVKLNSFDELPEVIKREIATNYPGYTAPPPVDDTRPNETTWTVFKKKIEAQRAKDGTKPAASH